MHLQLVPAGAEQEPRPAKVVQLEARREARLQEQLRPRPPQRPAA